MKASTESQLREAIRTSPYNKVVVLDNRNNVIYRVPCVAGGNKKGTIRYKGEIRIIEQDKQNSQVWNLV